jgi:hypothetical protein
VLGSGDSIGPSSTFIQNAQSGSDNWLVGVDGYLGFKFLNEDTGEINFGYAHITSTSPTGFPAVIVDYAYDQSGAEITIP